MVYLVPEAKPRDINIQRVLFLSVQAREAGAEGVNLSWILRQISPIFAPSDGEKDIINDLITLKTTKH